MYSAHGDAHENFMGCVCTPPAEKENAPDIMEMSLLKSGDTA